MPFLRRKKRRAAETCRANFKDGLRTGARSTPGRTGKAGRSRTKGRSGGKTGPKFKAQSNLTKNLKTQETSNAQVSSHSDPADLTSPKPNGTRSGSKRSRGEVTNLSLFRLKRLKLEQPSADVGESVSAGNTSSSDSSSKASSKRKVIGAKGSIVSSAKREEVLPSSDTNIRESPRNVSYLPKLGKFGGSQVNGDCPSPSSSSSFDSATTFNETQNIELDLLSLRRKLLTSISRSSSDASSVQNDVKGTQNPETDPAASNRKLEKTPVEIFTRSKNITNGTESSRPVYNSCARKTTSRLQQPSSEPKSTKDLQSTPTNAVLKTAVVKETDAQVFESKDAVTGINNVAPSALKTLPSLKIFRLDDKSKVICRKRSERNLHCSVTNTDNDKISVIQQDSQLEGKISVKQQESQLEGKISVKQKESQLESSKNCSSIKSDTIYSSPKEKNRSENRVNSKDQALTVNSSKEGRTRSKMGCIVYLGLGRPTHPAVHVNLKMQTSDGDIDSSWAKFAASAVQVSNRRPIVSCILVPIVYKQLEDLALKHFTTTCSNLCTSLKQSSHQKVVTRNNKLCTRWKQTSKSSPQLEKKEGEPDGNTSCCFEVGVKFLRNINSVKKLKCNLCKVCGNAFKSRPSDVGNFGSQSEEHTPSTRICDNCKVDFKSLSNSDLKSNINGSANKFSSSNDKSEFTQFSEGSRRASSRKKVPSLKTKMWQEEAARAKAQRAKSLKVSGNVSDNSSCSNLSSSACDVEITHIKQEPISDCEESASGMCSFNVTQNSNLDTVHRRSNRTTRSSLSNLTEKNTGNPSGFEGSSSHSSNRLGDPPVLTNHKRRLTLKQRLSLRSKALWQKRRNRALKSDAPNTNQSPNSLLSEELTEKLLKLPPSHEPCEFTIRMAKTGPRGYSSILCKKIRRPNNFDENFDSNASRTSSLNSAKESDICWSNETSSNDSESFRSEGMEKVLFPDVAEENSAIKCDFRSPRQELLKIQRKKRRRRIGQYSLIPKRSRIRRKQRATERRGSLQIQDAEFEEVEEEVKPVLDNIITYVCAKEVFDKMEIRYDDDYCPTPDVSETNTSSLYPAVLTDSLERTTEKKDRCARELARLNVNIIKINGKASDDPSTGVLSHCPKASCKFGCICETFSRKLETPLERCSQETCIFGCNCKTLNISKSSTGTPSILTPMMKKLEAESRRRLASKEFRETVFVSDHRSKIFLKNKRRDRKLPKRFTDHFVDVHRSFSRPVLANLFSPSESKDSIKSPESKKHVDSNESVKSNESVESNGPLVKSNRSVKFNVLMKPSGSVYFNNAVHFLGTAKPRGKPDGSDELNKTDKHWKVLQVDPSSKPQISELERSLVSYDFLVPKIMRVVLEKLQDEPRNYYCLLHEARNCICLRQVQRTFKVNLWDDVVPETVYVPPALWQHPKYSKINLTSPRTRRQYCTSRTSLDLSIYAVRNKQRSYLPYLLNQESCRTSYPAHFSVCKWISPRLGAFFLQEVSREKLVNFISYCKEYLKYNPNLQESLLGSRLSIGRKIYPSVLSYPTTLPSNFDTSPEQGGRNSSAHEGSQPCSETQTPVPFIEDAGSIISNVCTIPQEEFEKLGKDESEAETEGEDLLTPGRETVHTSESSQVLPPQDADTNINVPLRLRTTDAPQSTFDTPLSTNDAPQSTFNAPLSTFNAPLRTIDAPQSTNDAPQSTFDAPQSTFDAPQSTLDAPQSTFDAPLSTTDIPLSTFNAPLSTTNTPSSTFNAPLSTIDTPSSTFNAPKSTTDTPSSKEIPFENTIITHMLPPFNERHQWLVFDLGQNFDYLKLGASSTKPAPCQPAPKCIRRKLLDTMAEKAQINLKTTGYALYDDTFLIISVPGVSHVVFFGPFMRNDSLNLIPLLMAGPNSVKLLPLREIFVKYTLPRNQTVSNFLAVHTKIRSSVGDAILKTGKPFIYYYFWEPAKIARPKLPPIPLAPSKQSMDILLKEALSTRSRLIREISKSSKLASNQQQPEDNTPPTSDTTERDLFLAQRIKGHVRFFDTNKSNLPDELATPTGESGTHVSRIGADHNYASLNNRLNNWYENFLEKRVRRNRLSHIGNSAIRPEQSDEGHGNSMKAGPSKYSTMEKMPRISPLETDLCKEPVSSAESFRSEPESDRITDRPESGEVESVAAAPPGFEAKYLISSLEIVGYIDVFASTTTSQLIVNLSYMELNFDDIAQASDWLNNTLGKYVIFFPVHFKPQWRLIPKSELPKNWKLFDTQRVSKYVYLTEEGPKVKVSGSAAKSGLAALPSADEVEQDMADHHLNEDLGKTFEPSSEIRNSEATLKSKGIKEASKDSDSLKASKAAAEINFSKESSAIRDMRETSKVSKEATEIQFDGETSKTQSDENTSQVEKSGGGNLRILERASLMSCSKDTSKIRDIKEISQVSEKPEIIFAGQTLAIKIKENTSQVKDSGIGETSKDRKETSELDEQPTILCEEAFDINGIEGTDRIRHDEETSEPLGGQKAPQTDGSEKGVLSGENSFLSENTNLVNDRPGFLFLGAKNARSETTNSKEKFKELALSDRGSVTNSKEKFKELAVSDQINVTNSKEKFKELTATDRVSGTNPKEKFQELAVSDRVSGTNPKEKFQELAVSDRVSGTNPKDEFQELAVSDRVSVTNSNEKFKELVVSDRVSVTNPKEKFQKLAVSDRVGVTNSNEKFKELVVSDRVSVTNPKEKFQKLAVSDRGSVTNSNEKFKELAVSDRVNVTNIKGRIFKGKSGFGSKMGHNLISLVKPPARNNAVGMDEDGTTKPVFISDSIIKATPDPMTKDNSKKTVESVELITEETKSIKYVIDQDGTARPFSISDTIIKTTADPVKMTPEETKSVKFVKNSFKSTLKEGLSSGQALHRVQLHSKLSDYVPKQPVLSAADKAEPSCKSDSLPVSKAKSCANSKAVTNKNCDIGESSTVESMTKNGAVEKGGEDAYVQRKISSIIDDIENAVAPKQSGPRIFVIKLPDKPSPKMSEVHSKVASEESSPNCIPTSSASQLSSSKQDSAGPGPSHKLNPSAGSSGSSRFNSSPQNSSLSCQSTKPLPKDLGSCTSLSNSDTTQKHSSQIGTEVSTKGPDQSEQQSLDATRYKKILPAPPAPSNYYVVILPDNSNPGVNPDNPIVSSTLVKLITREKNLDSKAVTLPAGSTASLQTTNQENNGNNSMTAPAESKDNSKKNPTSKKEDSQNNPIVSSSREKLVTREKSTENEAVTASVTSTSSCLKKINLENRGNNCVTAPVKSCANSQKIPMVSKKEYNQNNVIGSSKLEKLLTRELNTEKKVVTSPAGSNNSSCLQNTNLVNKGKNCLAAPAKSNHNSQKVIVVSKKDKNICLSLARQTSSKAQTCHETTKKGDGQNGDQKSVINQIENYKTVKPLVDALLGINPSPEASQETSLPDKAKKSAVQNVDSIKPVEAPHHTKSMSSSPSVHIVSGHLGQQSPAKTYFVSPLPSSLQCQQSPSGKKLEVKSKKKEQKIYDIAPSKLFMPIYSQPALQRSLVLRKALKKVNRLQRRRIWLIQKNAEKVRWKGKLGKGMKKELLANQEARRKLVRKDQLRKRRKKQVGATRETNKKEEFEIEEGDKAADTVQDSIRSRLRSHQIDNRGAVSGNKASDSSETYDETQQSDGEEQDGQMVLLSLAEELLTTATRSVLEKDRPTGTSVSLDEILKLAQLAVNKQKGDSVMMHIEHDLVKARNDSLKEKLKSLRSGSDKLHERLMKDPTFCTLESEVEFMLDNLEKQSRERNEKLVKQAAELYACLESDPYPSTDDWDETESFFIPLSESFSDRDSESRES